MNTTVDFQPAAGCGIFVKGIAADKGKSGFGDVEIPIDNGGKGVSGVEVYNNTLISNQPVAAVVNIRGRNIGIAFRNTLVLSTAGRAAVSIDQDADAIIFQRNLYWSGGGPFKVAGRKGARQLPVDPIAVFWKGEEQDRCWVGIIVRLAGGFVWR